MHENNEKHEFYTSFFRDYLLSAQAVSGYISQSRGSADKKRRRKADE